MEWGEWRGHCGVAWGYDRPPDDVSEGGSFASWLRSATGYRTPHSETADKGEQLYKLT